MKVALLGGSRFIGFHLLRALAGLGHHVTVFNRALTRPPAPFPEGVTFIKGDRNRPGDLKTLFSNDYDVVFDIHGWKPEQVETIIRNYCSHIGHYIFLSTTAVYKNPPENPFDERSPRIFTKETGGGNKALAEEFLFDEYRQKSFPVTVFRPNGVIGPFDPCSVGLVFYRLMNSLPLFVFSEADKKINYLYVHDLVRALVLAMKNPATYGTAYVVAGDDITTPKEFIGLCGKICSRSPRLIFINDSVNYKNAKYVKGKRFVDFCIPWPTHDQICDNSKIKKELGVQFTDLKTALKETFVWLLERPSYLGYFRLRGEQYILTDRPIPMVLRYYWKLEDVFTGLTKGMKEMLEHLRFLRNGYNSLKGMSQL